MNMSLIKQPHNTCSLQPQPGTVLRSSLVDGVYETLVEGIISGQLQPGAELNSVALAEQLEVSRTPVKEAVRLLVRDGLAQQVNHHKARVVRFTRDDVRDTYEVRLLLEAAAAESAATRISSEVLDQLRATGERLRARRKNDAWRSAALKFDLQLHSAIAAACGNSRLEADIQRYRLLVRSFCRITSHQATLEQALEEHLTILTALVAGRPTAARNAMSTHIHARMEAVLLQMPEGSTISEIR